MSGQPASRSLPATVGRHAAEIAALKRKVLGPDPDAIRFNFANGSDPPDRYLLIRTSDPAPPGALPAIYLHDDGGAGVKLLAGAGGNLELASDGGNLILAGAGNASLTSSGGGIQIDADGLLAIVAGADTTLTTTGDTTVVSHGGISLTAGTSGATSPDGVLELLGYDAVELFCSIGDIRIDISNAGTPGDHCLRVTSNAASPNEIFRIDSDGTIHGQTAIGAILWDIT